MLLSWHTHFSLFLCLLRFGTADNEFTSSSQQNRDWIDNFLTVRHLAGWYIFNGNKFNFNFYIRTVHEYEEESVIATFDDQDHAVFDVIGKSSDDQTVNFTLVNMVISSTRFPTDIQFEMSGTITASATSLTYQGTVTKPPQFGAVFMSVYAESNLGSGNPEPSQSLTLLIVLVPASVGLIIFISTIIVICWSFKKGYFRNIPKSYRFLEHQPVTYSSEAEKVDI
ncbi:hypothetical protein CHS0354_004515 [Potamilus streckersoni]|uniref:Uncharacterized protein n=1 Tax=Potamilus streckersoni TaxID=2493646 RepID=A0AAE0S5M8_9BIVA|nr:hypothetical protein CHS0354_004515 [Potamilus streckersoni]